VLVWLELSMFWYELRLLCSMLTRLPSASPLFEPAWLEITSSSIMWFFVYVSSLFGFSEELFPVVDF